MVSADMWAPEISDPRRKGGEACGLGPELGRLRAGWGRQKETRPGEKEVGRGEWGEGLGCGELGWGLFLFFLLFCFSKALFQEVFECN